MRNDEYILSADETADKTAGGEVAGNTIPIIITNDRGTRRSFLPIDRDVAAILKKYATTEGERKRDHPLPQNSKRNRSQSHRLTRLRLPQVHVFAAGQSVDRSDVKLLAIIIHESLLLMAWDLYA